MTDKEYGQWLGTIFSAIPGGYGVCGVLLGFWQIRVGPVIVGGLFILLAYYIYSSISRAAEKRND